MRNIVLGAAAAVILLSAGTANGQVVAQPTVTPLDYLPSLKGGYFPLQSKAVGHLYHIYVRLPFDYEADPLRRYPVIYLLDGDALFPVIAPTHLYMTIDDKYLTIDDKLPEAIIVGISYGSFSKPTNRRHIDFRPPGKNVPANESGTAEFQKFLEAELIPAVEQRYRADPSRRILFGQTRAGAMVLYSAFTKPDLFWAHVAHNPSWEPGHELFFGAPPNAARRDLRLVVAIGTNEVPESRRTASEWFNHWRRRNGAPWMVKRLDIAGGTHSAYIAEGYRASIRWLFTDDSQRSR